jgi:hypothetical protein
MSRKLLPLSLKARKWLLTIGLLITLLLLVRGMRVLKNRKLSKDFYLNEFLVTNTGLSNVPDSASVENIQWAVTNFFQPLRDDIREPLVIISGFRSPAVNSAVGGVEDSKHMSGKGFDFMVAGRSGSWLKQKVIAWAVNAGFPHIDFIEAHTQTIHVEFI